MSHNRLGLAVKTSLSLRQIRRGCQHRKGWPSRCSSCLRPMCSPRNRNLASARYANHTLIQHLSCRLPLSNLVSDADTNPLSALQSTNDRRGFGQRIPKRRHRHAFTNVEFNGNGLSLNLPTLGCRFGESVVPCFEQVDALSGVRDAVDRAGVCRGRFRTHHRENVCPGARRHQQRKGVQRV